MFKTLFITAIATGLCATAFAAGGGGAEGIFMENKALEDMIFKTINFLLLLFLLNKFARKPIAKMLSSSAENTKKTADDAKTELAEAKKKLEDYQSKLANMETELEERRKSALAAIETEKAQLIEDAENQVKKLEEQSQARIEQDILKAKAEIREFLVSESVKMAEEAIAKEVGGKERKALFENYAKFIKESA